MAIPDLITSSNLHFFASFQTTMDLTAQPLQPYEAACIWIQT